MNTRIAALNPNQASGKTKQLLDTVATAIGSIPNTVRTMAHSPAVLQGYIGFTTALDEGLLSNTIREQIALAVSQANSCEYCLSAHVMTAGISGLSDAEIVACRLSTSNDPKVDAALKFVQAIVNKRGEVTDADLSRVREAGYSDGEIVEIVANVAINIFTNYFHNVAHPEVDFPKVEVSVNQ